MIATLNGTVAEKLTEQLVLEVNGVGYGIYITSQDFGQLTVGKQKKIFIYEHIKETNHDLFGFIDIQSKRLFEQLLGVNGVGPKMAMSIMELGTVEALKAAIASGDTRFIQAASGVGKRVAERLVVDLKDKVGLVSGEGATDFLQGPAMQDDAVQALVALGFTPQDAALALQKIDKKLPTEVRVKQALKAKI